MHYILYDSIFTWIVSSASHSCAKGPGSGLSLCHSFVRSHPFSDQLPMEHTGHLAAISWFPSLLNEPIWNAHILPIAIICQVLILLTHRGMEG